jgi:hypothetical protein
MKKTSKRFFFEKKHQKMFIHTRRGFNAKAPTVAALGVPPVVSAKSPSTRRDSARPLGSSTAQPT